MTKNNTTLQTLITTVRSLRGDKGCPWDKRQTSASLVYYLKSETAELVSAIENNDPGNICEELGDLLYIILMMAEIHGDLGDFDLTDVLQQIDAKLIRRHPHVFAGTSFESEAQLAEQWQSIKAAEKKKNSV